MLSLTSEEAESLRQLGARLRRRRLQAGDPSCAPPGGLGSPCQPIASWSRGTLAVWIRALRLYGNLEDLTFLFPETLFDEQAKRQRAPRGGA